MLNRRATQLYIGASPEEQQAIRRIFLRMVSQEGAGLTRRRVELAELQFGNGDDAEQQCVDEVKGSYVKAGLLVIDGDSIEPAHACAGGRVARAPRLAEGEQHAGSDPSRVALGLRLEGECERDGIPLERRPPPAAAGGRRRGRRPQRARASVRGRQLPEKEEQEAPSDRHGRHGHGSALALLAAGALVARHQAIVQRNEATSLALTSLTRTPPASNLDRVSLLLNLEAYKASPTLQARNAMLTALEEVPQTILRGGRQPVNQVAFARTAGPSPPAASTEPCESGTEERALISARP